MVLMLFPLAHSRFRFTGTVFTDAGDETWGVMVPFSFLDRYSLDPKDILRTDPITSEFAGKLDLLANKIYGSPDLDWVFVLFNNIENPLAGYPQIGTIVEYPSPALVLPQV
jgi:hypothetical protein